MFECRLCNSKDICVKYELGNWKVGRCKKCGFWQVLEKPSAEDFLKMYDVEYFEQKYIKKDRAFDLENKWRISWLKKNGLKEGSRILDVGCAAGSFIKAAKNQFDIWGLDISEFAVAKARSDNPDISQKIKAGTAEDANFPDNFFDCIVLWDVVEHLWDPVRTISKLTGKLKPKGMLVISTPDIGALSARLMGKHWHFMTVPRHLSFFNKNTINYLFEMTGLAPLNRLARGRWVNLEYLLYKIKKTFPGLLPTGLISRIQKKYNIASVVLYVPTHDSQYVAAIRCDKLNNKQNNK